MIEWRWNLPPLTIRDQTATNLAVALNFSVTNYSAPKFTVPTGPFGIPCPETTRMSRSGSNGTNLVARWLSDAKLHFAPDLSGSWTPVTNVAIPYTIVPTNSAGFYRVVDKWTALVEKARQFGFPSCQDCRCGT